MIPSLIVFHSVVLSAFLELYAEHLVIVSYCHVIIFFPFCLYQQFTNISGKTLSIYLFIYFIYSFI